LREQYLTNLLTSTNWSKGMMQTDEQLRKHNIQGKRQANDVHYEIGRKVRDAIRDIGGTIPEDLPKPQKSIKELERQKKTLFPDDKT